VAMNFRGHATGGGRTCTVIGGRVGNILMPSVANPGEWWIAFESEVLLVLEFELVPFGN